MDTSILQNKITDAIIANSGLEQNRDYVGISKIGDCPRVIYREFFHGARLAKSESTHFFCYAGYHHEESIAKLLEFAGVLDPATRGQEVVSSISPIFKGHIDGLTKDGDLLEFKSVSNEKFETVRKKGKTLYRHFVQVLLYMRYGHWKRSFVVYRNRDTYEHIVIQINYMKNIADNLEEKAKEILGYIERKELPACTCGHCEE